MRLWVVQSFVSSQILFATGDFLKINAIVSSVNSLANWKIYVRLFLLVTFYHIVRIPPFHSVGCFQSLF